VLEHGLTPREPGTGSAPSRDVRRCRDARGTIWFWEAFSWIMGGSRSKRVAWLRRHPAQRGPRS
jgi:hypothetical protein